MRDQPKTKFTVVKGTFPYTSAHMGLWRCKIMCPARTVKIKRRQATIRTITDKYAAWSFNCAAILRELDN